MRRSLDAKAKRAYTEFEASYEHIRLQTKLIKAETPGVKELRKGRLLNDYRSFVEYYFSHYAKEGTVADFQVKAVEECVSHMYYRHVAQWARGHAKSLTFDTFLPIFLMLKGNLKYGLIVGNNLKKATELLSPLLLELKTNIRLINDYGEFFKTIRVKADEFITNDDVKFKAIGIGQSPRGLRHRANRVDYICLDDVDDDETCLNENRVLKHYNWVKGALIGTFGHTEGRFIACGNKISKNSVIQMLEDDPAFTCSVVNALDKNGKVTWGQVYSQELMERKIKEAGKRIAGIEYFNNPIVEGKVFKEKWLRYENIRDDEFDLKVAYLDPSRSNSERADYKAIVTVGLKDDVYYILDIFCRRSSMHVVGHYFYDIVSKWGSDTYLVSETIFGQVSHFRDFEDVFKQKGERLNILADNSKKRDKVYRINNLDSLFELGRVIINSQLRHTDEFDLFKHQLLGFPDPKVHDDAPDALEGAISYIKNKSRQSGIGYGKSHFTLNFLG